MLLYFSLLLLTLFLFTFFSIQRYIPSILIVYIFSLNSWVTHLHIQYISHSLSHYLSLTHILYTVQVMAYTYTHFSPHSPFFSHHYIPYSPGTVPANYPQCHSHYFPILAANLLHTFPFPPTLAEPSAPRQLLASFSSSSTSEAKRKKKQRQEAEKNKR